MKYSKEILDACGICSSCGKQLLPESGGYLLREASISIDYDWQGKLTGGVAFNDSEGEHYAFCKKCGEKRIPKRGC